MNTAIEKKPWEIAESETQWEILEARPKLSEEFRKSVGLNQIKCPLCEGSRRIYLQCRGVTTGIIWPKPTACPCILWRHYVPLAVKIPKHYAAIRLENLKFSSLSILKKETQLRAIKLIQEHPDDSYLFFGPPKTGKTTFTLALYERAIRKFANDNRYDSTVGRPPIWRISARTLLEQYHDYAISRERYTEDGKLMKSAPRDVTRQMIEFAARVGMKPRLFLEEIDKIKPTDFRLSNLFEVIDAIYENDGQLVMNSNMTPGGLASFLGDIYGQAIPNRISESGRVLDFFEVEKKSA